MSEVFGVPVSLLSAFVVVVPIVAAALPLAFGRWTNAAGVGVALAATAVNVCLAGALAWGTFSNGGPIVTELGGYDSSQGGIELVVDGVSAVVVVLIAVVGFAILVAGLGDRRRNSFYSLYLLLLAGLSGVGVTGDVFNMYVFLEISGLAAYALIASDGTGRSALAALKYLLMGTVGASLYLIGIGYAYVATGYLNMADLSTAFAEVGYGDPQVLAAFAFMVSGFAIKIALFPVHTWQPDAYAESPDRVTALVAALVSTTAAYALTRLVLTVYTVDFFTANPIVHEVLLWTTAISVIAGSVFAVLQRDVKRMLAYSSVSQFGLIVVGVVLLTDSALVGSIVHLVGHAIVKGALFLGVALFTAVLGVRTVDEFDGLAERAPIASGAFAVLALALVGVPPTVGFLGKLYIAIGAVEAESWLLVAVIVASTVLTLGYVMRLLERMYFTPPAEPAPGKPVATATDGGTNDDVHDVDGAERPTNDGSVDGDATDDHVGRVAADGFRAGAVGSQSSSASRTGRETALLSVIVVAAIVSVVLGFAGTEFEALLEPTVNALLDT